jgi:II/X family phage/plasmid replication protein
MVQNRKKGGENWKMMIDTIAIDSPEVGIDSIEKIEQFLEKYTGVDMQTGEVLYQFTRGKLKGSYDSSVSVKILREKLVQVFDGVKSGKIEAIYFTDTDGQKKKMGYEINKSETKMKMVKQSCEPYLSVECSIHKLLLGHNVYGGPIDVGLIVKFIVNLLKEKFDVDLPEPRGWRIRRIDVAEVYNMGSFEGVQEYIRGLNHCSYPRKKVIPYQCESIYVPGRITTLKLYHKGPEFHQHDRKRLLKFMKAEKVEQLQNIANKILRVEMEIKAQRLRELNCGELPTFENIEVEYLQNRLNKEVFNLLHEKQEPDRIEIYRTTDAVLNRLNEIFPVRKARTLYNTWIKLASLGEQDTKKIMCKNTFYEHRRELIAVSVSWHHSDIVVNKQYSGIPVNFMPVSTDKRCFRLIAKPCRLAA